MNVLWWAHNAYLAVLVAVVVMSLWTALRTDHER
jgi:hypothetical protein